MTTNSSIIANTDRFMTARKRYFTGAYETFCSFGGPCVYFHEECLKAGAEDFLSPRHVEMIYATLTAWGMHRMGDRKKTKTKLTNWKSFSGSIMDAGDKLGKFRDYKMLKMTETAYADAVRSLEPIYRQLTLSVADATVVVNSKALFHLLPEFIPPVDRQYTIRFFTQLPERWLDHDGKFKAIQLPKGIDVQFDLFCKFCTKMKSLADLVELTEAGIFDQERKQHSLVSAPKALDNAIVNFVSIVAEERRQLLLVSEPLAIA
jgi:hypothetical protein